MKQGHRQIRRLSIILTGALLTNVGSAAVNTANLPSTLVTSQAVLQTKATQVSNVMSARINYLRNSSSMMLPTAEQPFWGGVSSGDIADWGFGVWANGSYYDIKNNFSATQFSGQLLTAMIGIDTMLGTKNTILGIALGWEDQDFTTDFNNGTQDANGWSVNPYLAFYINRYWALSVMAGYSWLDYDLVRGNSSAGSRLSGSSNANRWYISGDAHYQYPCDRWRFTANASILYSNETRDDFTETGFQMVAQPEQETKLGRFTLGGSIGYNLNGYIEPYIRAAFLWDFTQTDIVVATIQPKPANGETAGEFGGGINLYINDIFKLNVDAYTEQFRDDYDRWGISGMIIASF